MTAVLRRLGYPMNRKRVQRLMRQRSRPQTGRSSGPAPPRRVCTAAITSAGNAGGLRESGGAAGRRRPAR
ncbi:hypothetical protein [Aquisalimonas sp.]|uniref:hypothetical protein n=1 Tax=Aquisalimonas sp. TaxID=1872621 RepID=UPI0034526DE4